MGEITYMVNTIIRVDETCPFYILGAYVREFTKICICHAGKHFST
jgi:hypothetical protein